ncbi:MAG: hypothetical protein HGB26_01490 [Desulfobulbaceae bacterium]|nr:hypothetical protein [Desulfobulbaceae bacterium]
MPFKFPRTVFVSQNDYKSQMPHVIEEIEEVMEAIADMETIDRIADEVFDAMQSLETEARILQEQNGVNWADVEVRGMARLKDRGYYS